ncbi:glycosyltransferase family 4 protein [Paeniglutamicibacter sp. ZC-3]|uniref:glycosyltransferase family 4 protein n=1 Tax=Paeniglutamicibacter sp. ZC-3 TaxID=2986919 RepID=UPI00355638D4
MDKSSAGTARKRWIKTQVEVIPNPVRVRIPEVDKDFVNQRRIVYLGWLTTAKGIEDLLEVWEALTPSYPNWHLALVGGVSDTYRKKLAQKYKAGRWLMEGEVSHARAMTFLASSEILVLPSYSEGFPNVILEAMSLAKPVVATRVGAMEEMLSEGGGLLVTPGSLDELTKALSHLMTDDEYRTQTGHKGCVRVMRDYDVSAITNKYRRLWGV